MEIILTEFVLGGTSPPSPERGRPAITPPPRPFQITQRDAKFTTPWKMVPLSEKKKRKKTRTTTKGVFFAIAYSFVSDFTSIHTYTRQGEGASERSHPEMQRSGNSWGVGSGSLFVTHPIGASFQGSGGWGRRSPQNELSQYNLRSLK